MDQSPRGFASEDEEATYCLSLLRDGDRNQQIVARERLSQIFERRGLLDEAAECLESNIRAGVRDPRAYQRLAGIYRRQGRHEIADEVLLEARRLQERLSRGQPPGGRRPAPGRPVPPGQRPAPPPHPLEAPTAPLPAAAPPPRGPAASDRTAELAMDAAPPAPAAADLPAPPPGQPAERPWWLSPPVIVLLILLCGPFGLALMWVRGSYSRQAKLTATAVWAGLTILVLAAVAVTAQNYVASLVAGAGQLAPATGIGPAPTPIVFPTPAAVASPKPAGGPAAAPSPPAIAASPGALEPRPSPVLIGPAGTGTPGAAASPAPGGAPGTPGAGGERVRVIATDGSGANLRERPGQSEPVVKTLPDGAVLQVVGADQQADGRSWRNVRDESGAQGWVAAELLEPAP